MKLLLVYLALVCCFGSFVVARQVNSTGDGFADTNGTAKNLDISRKESELAKLYEIALEKVRNKDNAEANTVDIVRNLIETNATGLLEGYLASCPPYSNAHGIYTVKVTGLEPFPVFCDSSIAGAGWTVIQRRIHGNINFFRTWSQYKHGFGNISDEFFIGLDKLHAITESVQHELYILLEDFDGNKRHARYDDFLILNEATAYNLHSVGKYSGDAGDSLTNHVGSKFSTYDRKNNVGGDMCAELFMGAWWYNNCGFSSLNGLYLNGDYPEGLHWKGVHWNHWRGYKYSYKFAQMMIRPKCPNSYEN